MKGDFHVRFRENLRVQLPWVTRLVVMPVTRHDINCKDESTFATETLATIFDFVGTAYDLLCAILYSTYHCRRHIACMGYFISDCSYKLLRMGLVNGDGIDSNDNFDCKTKD